MISLLGAAQNADRNLTSEAICWTGTPDASNARLVQAVIYLGDGAKDLDGSGGIFRVRIGLDDQIGCVHAMTVSPGLTRVWFRTEIVSVPANTAVTISVLSPNGADSDVDVTVSLFDVHPGYPLLSADSGDSQIARTGAGGDTLETLSDQADAIEADTQDLQSQIGTAGDGLTNIGDARIGNLDAAVTSRLAMADYTAPDNATIATIAGYLDTEVAAILEATGTSIPALISALQVVLDKYNTMVEADGDVYRFTQNAMEEAGGGGGGDATAAKQDEILEDLADIKGTGFVKDVDSLVNLSAISPTNLTIETEDPQIHMTIEAGAR